MNSYFDDLGRLHTKPITPEDNFPTNNAWIYSAIYYTILKMDGKSMKEYEVNKIRMAIGMCEVMSLKGLYSRHPMPYRLAPNHTAVSHDEIIGIAMLSLQYANDIKRRSDLDAYFCDVPNHEIKRKYSLITKAKAWSSYLYRVIVKKENQRRTTKDYPELFGTFFTHRRQYRYIYESLSERPRSILNGLAWASARLLDSVLKNVSLMHYMVMVRMEQRNNRSFIFKLVAKAMNRSIIKKYGERPVEAMLIEYLLDGVGYVDKNHPWLVKIAEYYRNKGK
jgi:hypothetical protein